MVGGGIFSILGISVGLVGNATPIALLIGGVLAFFAAYSYVKLSALYKDEGPPTLSFQKLFQIQSLPPPLLVGSSYLVISVHLHYMLLHSLLICVVYCQLKTQHY